MRDSRIHKAGLSLCVALIAAAGVCLFSGIANAQPPLITGTPTPSLPTTPPIVTLPSVPNPATIVNQQVGQLTTQMTAQVNQIISQQLATLPGLNSLQSIQQITDFLQNPSLQAAMQGLPALAQGQILDGLLNGSIDPEAIQSLIQQGVTTAITNAITTQFPEVANILNGGLTGGLQGAVDNALTQVGTQIGDAIGDAIGGPIGDIIGGVIGGILGGGVNTPAPNVSSCGNPCNCNTCRTQIPRHYAEVRSTVTNEFQVHRSWLVNNFWRENILPAMMLMAGQLSATGIQQVNMIGMMLDAKHQLETQRLFQQMTAAAHKDYHPSEGMCTFGTTVRSLANSERKSDLSQTAFATRMNQRQTMAGESLSTEGADSDIRSRLSSYIANYCDQADNANNLDGVCQLTAAPERKNIDVDYTRNIESRLTLDADFTTPGNTLTPDEQDVFALSANLFSHNIAPRFGADELAVADGRIREAATLRYMDQRAIFAKRSVAQNSFAAIASQRAAGSPESAPYTKALIRELGVRDSLEIEKLLGANPSYFAQMEILTKKIYQSPLFYTELYDKPVNIERKGAALQAIGLMQDRDLYNSLIRTEAVLSVLLETMLQKEQSKIANAIPGMTPVGGAR